MRKKDLPFPAPPQQADFTTVMNVLQPNDFHAACFLANDRCGKCKATLIGMSDPGLTARQLAHEIIVNSSAVARGYMHKTMTPARSEILEAITAIRLALGSGITDDRQK